MLELYEIYDDIKSEDELEDIRKNEMVHYRVEAFVKKSKNENEGKWYPIGNWLNYEDIHYYIKTSNWMQSWKNLDPYQIMIRDINTIKIEKRGRRYLINNGTTEIPPKIYEEIFLTSREIRAIRREYSEENIYKKRKTKH